MPDDVNSTTHSSITFSYLLGWRGYFGFCQTPSVLRNFDSWIHRRLRCYAWKQWKTGKRRFAELRRLGIGKDLAAQTAGSRKRYWHISRSPALSMSLSRAYLTQAKMEDMEQWPFAVFCRGMSGQLKSTLDWVFKRCRRMRNGNSVLLTFDDGPDPAVTPLVLDRLRQYNVRAIFFVVGDRIPKAPELLPRILEAGHLLGNHSFSHWLEKEPGPIAYYRDVCRCQDRLRSITGHTPTLYRAPLGRTSFCSLLVPRLLGLRHVLWSQDEKDWMLRNERDAESLGCRLAGKVENGDIVLLHDDNPWVVTVLDVLLPRLAQRNLDLQSAVENLGT